MKRARAGEEIIIADDGKPVAKLVPIGAPPEPRVLGGDPEVARYDVELLRPG